MDRPSYAEIVARKLLHGRVQKKVYLRTCEQDNEFTAYGTVAVVLRDQKFLISIKEFHSPTTVTEYEDWDVDELITATDLGEVEAILKSKLGLTIADLGPDKGIKTTF